MKKTYISPDIIQIKDVEIDTMLCASNYSAVSVEYFEDGDVLDDLFE